MSNVRFVPLLLGVVLLIGTTPFVNLNAASISKNRSALSPVRQGKFVGRWSSTIKSRSGESYNDGVLDIADGPDEDEVTVVHSTRGGPIVGYTFAYPDRIEIQISLGDGRVAHYNGVLVSRTRIEGRFFVTGRPQSHHAKKVVFAEDGTWTAQAGST